MAKANLTHGRLVDVLDYDQLTGTLFWKTRTSNRVSVGAIAGRKNGNGYLRISIDGRGYYAHRLAWMYVHGSMPDHEIDHIDGNRSNNSIANLREATHGENGQNQPLRKTNTSGHHGVSWSRLHGKWAAYIWVGGKKRHLGLYERKGDAAQAYLMEKARSHTFQPVPRDINA